MGRFFLYCNEAATERKRRPKTAFFRRKTVSASACNKTHRYFVPIYEYKLEGVVLLLKPASDSRRSVVLFSLVLILLSALFPLTASGETADSLTGYPCINTESEKAVLASPDGAASAVGILQQNTIFQVLAEQNGWLKISVWDSYLSTRTAGWITKDAVRKTAYFDGANTAIVHNPNPADRLHLRKKPRVSSASLGKYYNGVVVAVLEDNINAEWMRVRIGTQVGYMQRKYLKIGAAPASVASARPMVMVSNSAGKGLHLRAYPGTSAPSSGLYANGTQALVLGITEQWYHVQIGDEFGFMMAKGITPHLQYEKTNNAPAKKTNAKRQKAVVTGETCMYLYDSENSLEVITTLPTGEVVTVLQNRSNGWSKVSNGIRQGYVLTKHLKFK